VNAPFVPENQHSPRPRYAVDALCGLCARMDREKAAEEWLSAGVNTGSGSLDLPWPLPVIKRDEWSMHVGNCSPSIGFRASRGDPRGPWAYARHAIDRFFAASKRSPGSA
jgi:hypothetical protein